MSDTDKKFNEELEEELGKELGHKDSEKDEEEDYTVKVHREEYVVKRRFYDKDKALETAESLRMDTDNLVEDNIEGEIASPGIDADDEEVDWDKLVDSGLEFYPPIAEAAESKPGEKPVGLTVPDEAREGIDQKALERTMLVKKRPVATEEAEKPVEDEVSLDDASQPISELEPEPLIDNSEITTPGTQKSKAVLVGLVFIVAAVLFYIFMAPADRKQRVETDSEKQKKTIAKTLPASEPPAEVKKTPPKQEKTPAKAVKPPGKQEKEPAKAVKPPVKQKTAPAVAAKPPAKQIKPKEKPKQPEDTKPVPVVENHYPYSVHISSYKSLEKTIVAVSRIKKKGLDPFTGLVSIPGKGDWYRVYVGYHGTYKEAVKAASKVKAHLREGASAAKAIWAVQVGKTATREELAGLIKSLGGKGYYFCKIPVASGSEYIRLLAGAYKTEQEPASMLRALKKDGFHARAVKR